MYNDGSSLGWSVMYRDGTLLTNLSYPEAMMYFSEAKETNNPCCVRMPGNHLTEQQQLNG
jgi:hypothetical protein